MIFFIEHFKIYQYMNCSISHELYLVQSFDEFFDVW
jgi:hypothetical protein